MKQALTSPQRYMLFNAPQNMHLAFEFGQWLNISIFLDNRLRHFFSYNIVKWDALCWSLHSTTLLKYGAKQSEVFLLIGHRVDFCFYIIEVPEL